MIDQGCTFQAKWQYMANLYNYRFRLDIEDRHNLRQVDYMQYFLQFQIDFLATHAWHLLSFLPNPLALFILQLL
jgi:hypothetical protein